MPIAWIDVSEKFLPELTRHVRVGSLVRLMKPSLGQVALLVVETKLD
jgi:hypothetical protein